LKHLVIRTHRLTAQLWRVVWVGHEFLGLLTCHLGDVFFVLRTVFDVHTQRYLADASVVSLTLAGHANVFGSRRAGLV
jgi:hypothetical protein